MSFKYPQTRDIAGLINVTSIDSGKKDRIYQFLNKYSHLDRIETSENLIENRMEESKNIIEDVIEMLNCELPTHYKNMCKTCNV